MKRKLGLTVGLLVLLSLMSTTVAVAEELEGSGPLWATGVGYARVRGNGAVDIWVRGAGTVWVQGAEALRAEGHGRRWDLPGGGTVLAGWKGHIDAAGNDMDIKMWGGVLEFNARGTGWVFLKGRGHYRAHGQSGRWTREGVRVEY